MITPAAATVMAHAGSRWPLTASPPIVSSNSSPGIGSAAQSSATARNTTRYPCARTRPARNSKLMAPGESKPSTRQVVLINKVVTTKVRAKPELTSGQNLIGRSALYRSGSEAGDVVVEEPHIDDDDGHARQHGTGHQRAPVINVPADQVRGDADHRRLVAALRDERQRVDELVPAQREAEERGAHDTRH